MGEAKMTFRWKLLLVAVVAAAVGLFGIGIPHLAWREGVSVDAVLQMAELIISWPVAVLVIAMVFLIRFRSGLQRFLENIGSVKLPGGVEIQSQAAKPSESEDTVEDRSVTLTPEQQGQLRAMFSELRESRDLTEAQRAEVEERFEAAAVDAIGWRFRYLNLHLVPNTKRVLLWFSQPPYKSRGDFEATWGIPIPQQGERNAIVQALVECELLDESEGRLMATQLGYSFLHFLGYASFPPPSSSS